MIPYRIALVFDKFYGEKLFDLAENLYVWIIGSETNRKYVKDYWDTHPANESIDPATGGRCFRLNLDKGVTMMEDVSTPFDSELLDDLWDHHGMYAHDPPLSEILVIGLPFTDDVKRTIDDYGLSVIEKRADWFLVKDGATCLNDNGQ